MSVLRIPTDSASTSRVWQQTTALEGTEYVFAFYWSGRESRFYVSLLNQSQAVLAASIAIVVEGQHPEPVVGHHGLLQRWAANGNVPPGALYAIDLSGAGTEIQQPSDLGSRVVLLYLTSDEV